MAFSDIFGGKKKLETSSVPEQEHLVQAIKTNMPEHVEDVQVSKLPEIEPEPKVIEAAPAPLVPAVKSTSGPVVDALGLLYFIWILYKLNIITRLQVKEFLDIIRRGDWPQDVLKYLGDEVKKI